MDVSRFAICTAMMRQVCRDEKQLSVDARAERRIEIAVHTIHQIAQARAGSHLIVSGALHAETQASKDWVAPSRPMGGRLDWQPSSRR